MQPTDFGKYLLLDRLAVGGMAEVYRGKLIGEQGFEKLVVIKRMLPQIAAKDDMVTAFIDEARLAALLQHENIIHVYDFGIAKTSLQSVRTQTGLVKGKRANPVHGDSGTV